MVDLDPALGEELFDITVGEAEAEIPADRQHITSGGKPKPPKADRGTGVGDGGFSCGQSRCSDARAANATVPRALPSKDTVEARRCGRRRRLQRKPEIRAQHDGYRVPSGTGGNMRTMALRRMILAILAAATVAIGPAAWA
jgi:hypothetical protein